MSDPRRGPPATGAAWRWIVLGFGLFLVGAAALIGWSGWDTTRLHWDLARRGAVAEARIVDYQDVRHRHGKSWRPIYRFTAADGRPVRAASGVTVDSLRPASAPDGVRVVYDPLDPGRVMPEAALLARSPTAMALLLGGAVLLLGGAGLGAVAWAAFARRG